MRGQSLLLAATLTLTACVGSTGGDLFTLEASARGPATADGTLSFVNGKGYEVTLDRALVRVGAVYLNRSVPTSVSSGTSCTLTGVYVAEAFGPLVVDALSNELQPFPGLGEATANHAQTGEVWLTGGNTDDPHDASIILDVAGTAARDGVTDTFRGQLTIGENRLADTPPEEPGQKPICKERIVSPVPVNLTPTRGKRLVLTVDPARMFANVNFSLLARGDDGTLEFDDDPSTATPPSTNLYVGLRASSGVYDFSFEP